MNKSSGKFIFFTQKLFGGTFICESFYTKINTKNNN